MCRNTVAQESRFGVRKKKQKTRPDLHLGPRSVARVISSARCQGVTSFSVHINVILTYLNLKYEIWWN